ncbi:lipase family protein [Psychroserpens luteus]|uniref:Lipase family protein n=1 Tax=Psychroserpens luteus TaxID=1434066 RepID=A0ABW5ZVW7_9FLAO|nr:lipase family protein [Psychroserpens luteus]
MKENLYKYINKADWKNTGFCENKAYVCSQFSKLIYNYKPTDKKDRTNFFEINEETLSKNPNISAFNTFINNFDFRVIFIFENKDSVTIGLSINRAIIIASRGTSYWKDWGINLNFFKATVCNIEKLKFHRGFNKIATKTVDKIYKKISAETAPIYFTGHSLGGALSGIFYYNFTTNCNCIKDVRLKNNNKISGYTFGMPRFSNKTVNKTDSLFNLYNPLDIVPMTPPKAFGYKNQKSEYELSELGLELRQERKRIKTLKKLSVIFKGKATKEHNIDRYISFLHPLVNN